MTTNDEPDNEPENKPETRKLDHEHGDEHGGSQARPSMPKAATGDAPEDGTPVEKVDLENLPEGFEYIEKLVGESAPDDDEIRQETEEAEEQNGGRAAAAVHRVRECVQVLRRLPRSHRCQLFRQRGRNALHPGPLRRGQVGVAAAADGLLQA